MGARRGKDNVNWKIGLLEAKKGQVPMVGAAHAAVRRKERRRLSQAKKVARSQGRRRTDAEAVLAEGLADPEEPEEEVERQLQDLLREKCARKVFALKKELRRSVKKARTLEAQKVSKRLQVLSKKEEETKERTTLQTKLEALKALDLAQETDRLFDEAVAKEAHLASHPLLLPSSPTMEKTDESTTTEMTEGSTKKVSVLPLTGSLRAAVDSTLQDISKTLDLLGDPEKRKEEQAERRRRRQLLAPTSFRKVQNEDDMPIGTTASSLFLSSLGGEDDEEEDEEETHARESSKRQRRLGRQGDDDEEDDDFLLDLIEEDELVVDGKDIRGGFEDSNFDQYYGGTKGKKNRAGQRARQQKAESKFGRDANHVKQRETVKAVKLTSRRGPSSAWTKPSSAPAPVDIASLHPSWQAKKAQETAKFEGKKLTFDTDETGEEGFKSAKADNISKASKTDKVSKSSKTDKTSKSAKADKITKTSTTDPDMHPSWEAKRRQQKALSISTTGGSGKNKIKFDSDED
ncbi:hypothetical protein BJ684DRAFT_20562 [Piptocephalis cylindrospora]|uniref:Bud22 domain-containing protein n=1 Tax=Piptocephalis cylindrospora TaxID=1907219 RepID=A0A4P9Y464_9FUNG|nr:hypothetical protein BJ684DRAFT_20562 [Piptocephalis cylindrospora]|eukprot:RKP12921.1 hypothetical protein BJ684DRAFT_20562 [Piptocephalis cylindrospora]